MNLEAVAGYLASKRVGTVGKDLFINDMPTGCTQGILLLPPYGGTPIDYYLEGYRTTEFTVAIRSTDYRAGEKLAWDVIRALRIHADRQMDKMLVKQMLPMNEPRPYKRSVGAYWEFEVEVSCRYVDQR